MSYMSNNYDPKKHSLFKPKNPEKYVGKSLPVMRSSYEVKFAEWCDRNDQVLAWNSEELAIPYFDSVKKKQRRYYPDFVIRVKDKRDKIKVYIVEVKPHKETVRPKKTNKKAKKTLLREEATWNTNLCKWKAATSFAARRGWYFKLITENHLF